MNKYYIYFHINSVKNEIFYVGRGCRRRAYQKSSRSELWKRTTKKYGYIIDIVETGLSNEEADEREKWYIKRIGRRDQGKGPLVNLTDGGEGIYGISEDTRYKMVKSWENRGPVSQETKDKISKAGLGRIVSQETKDKMRIGNLGKKRTQETKDKLSQTNLGKKRKPFTQETIYKMSKPKSEEHKANIKKARNLRNKTN